MAVTIDATVGGATANSYVTLASANSYMEGRLNATTWDDATDDEKNRALVEATHELEVQPWDGTRVTTTQALAWPRQWVVNPDDPNYNDYSTTVIPSRVTTAQMELAFQFIKSGTTDVAALDPTDGIIRKKVDVLETEYSEHGRLVRGLRRYPRVWEHIEPLLTRSASMLDVVRG
jgi:hypothetical protein